MILGLAGKPPVGFAAAKPSFFAHSFGLACKKGQDLSELKCVVRTPSRTQTSQQELPATARSAWSEKPSAPAMPPVLWEISNQGRWHESKLLKILWVWAGLFQTEAQGERTSTGSAERMSAQEGGRRSPGVARWLGKEPLGSSPRRSPTER